MNYNVEISSAYDILANIVDERTVDVNITEDVIEYNVELQSIIELNNIEYATKSSAVDAGMFGDKAFDDDYLYICTKSGAAGSAIWKKILLINT
jgi:hypothetical protein